MPSNFCLTKTLAQKFKDMVADGRIDQEKLGKMFSGDRLDFFAKEFGEVNAKEMNAILESKYLLKNQQAGILKWVKQMGNEDGPVVKDIMSKVNGMTKILDTASGDGHAFLQSLASKRMGTEITDDVARQIVSLSNKVKETDNYVDDAGRIKNGRAMLDLMDYIAVLNPKKNNIVLNLLSLPRSAMSGFDLSAPLNQGFGEIGTKSWNEAFGKMFKYATNSDEYENLRADILTDKMYKFAKKAGLRITNIGSTPGLKEENYISSAIDKVPGYLASERAYVGFTNKLRFAEFKKLVNLSEAAGEDVSYGSRNLEDIAKTVNMFSGGSKVFMIDNAAPWLNTVIWSPRKIASAVNIVNPWTYLNPKISKTVRVTRIKRLLAMSSYSVMMGKMAEMASGGSVTFEANPLSSDFGKLKSGNTRLDLTGGLGSYITFIARTLEQSTKSTKTGDISKIGGYGSDYNTYLGRFIRSKFAPTTGLAFDLAAGKDVVGNEVTPSSAIINRFIPMFESDAVQAMQDTKSSMSVPASIISLFGANLNTYTEDTTKSSGGRKTNRETRSSIRSTER